MAKKRCPACQQTLPVACKSCPCGHIFITKKCHVSRNTEDGKNDQPLPLKRLRPERPKREIPDYEYRDDYTRISVNGVNSQLKTHISKRMKLFEDDDEDDDDDDDAFSFIDGKGFERLNSLEIGTRPGGKKKRGRPKGSKNKPKDSLFSPILEEDYSNIDNDDASQSFPDAARKPGRPKGSKNKPPSVTDGIYNLAPIPEEKVVLYSLILSDINERWMSQNKIKCLPGL